MVVLSALAKEESVLYSNQYVVWMLDGLTVPRKVAVVVATGPATRVVTTGTAVSGGPAVVKVSMVPLAVPN